MRLSVFLLLVALLFIIPAVSAEEVVFTTSGSWPVPDGVTSIDVILVGGAGGGGGGGGGSYLPNPPYTGFGGDGGGGGGSGYIETVSSVAVTPGSTLTFTIGSGGLGGTGGSPTGGSGSNGGATTLSGTGISAAGGIGGKGGTSTGVGTGGTGYHAGSNGNSNSGGTGGSGGAGGSASYATYSTGGNGGTGGNGWSGGANPGTVGTAGTAGYLKITYTVSNESTGWRIISYNAKFTNDPNDKGRIHTTVSANDVAIRSSAAVLWVDTGMSGRAGIQTIGDISNITNISFAYNWYEREVTIQGGYATTRLVVALENTTLYDDEFTTDNGIDTTGVIEINATQNQRLRIYTTAIGVNAVVVAGVSTQIWDLYINGVLRNVTLGVSPISDFTATPLSGYTPLSVSFMDLSTGAPTTWNWSFGDGSTSSEQNPSHSYTTVGNHTVSLTVENEFGSDAITYENYISTVEGSAYGYPVTITDATTGYTISNSNLSASQIVNGSETNHYNATSATGKFNFTGYGPTMAIPITAGDVIGLFGTADGYQENGWSIIAGPSNNGITQIIPLPPNSIIPKTGEFSAVIMAYDGDTSMGISGAKITVSNANYSQSKYTLAGGVASFKNMTATATYTATVSASGYSTTSKTFTGSSGEIRYVDIPMSPSGVNPDPTVTVTATPTGTGTYGPEASDDDLSSWIRSHATSILDFLYLFIILGLVGTILRIFKLV